jgi:hypothetical protein
MKEPVLRGQVDVILCRDGLQRVNPCNFAQILKTAHGRAIRGFAIS